MPISAVVLAKNEEKNLETCLKSLSFCDEIVVIDDNSTDKTVEISKKLGANVFARALNGDFSSQRNFGLTKAKNEWVLFLDADEVVSKKLEREVKRATSSSSNKDGFFIKRKDIWLGKALRYGEFGQTRLLRLAKKGKGVWRRKVHETWEVDGKLGFLTSPLYHFSVRNLSDFLEKLNFYSSVHFQENYSEGKTPSLFKIVFYPLFKFTFNFIIRLGFLDGTRGFVAAVLMSFHSFLSWSALWLKLNLSK